MATFIENLARALNAFGGMRPVTARVAKDRLSVMLTNQRVSQFAINDRESMLKNVSELLKDNNIKICEEKAPYLTCEFCSFTCHVSNSSVLTFNCLCYSVEKDEIGLHFPVESRRVS